MRYMKYVILKSEHTDNEYIFIFPNTITHGEFVCTHTQFPPSWKAVRAGTVELGDDGELYCNGEATSLKLKSDSAKDTKLLRRQFRSPFNE